MAEQPAFVLDSFALLSYLQDEMDAPRIEKHLENAKKGKSRLFVSLINLGEILYITERKGGLPKAQEALAGILQLPLEVLPVDEQIVFSAAHIKANHHISYADSFAVAAAIRQNAVIVTGDPEFKSVESLATIEWMQK
jgi:predicted nucleic acid-binding protein